MQRLRYKDYQLAARPIQLSEIQSASNAYSTLAIDKLNEVETVKEFAQAMEQIGVHQWWRRAMGFPDRPAG